MKLSLKKSKLLMIIIVAVIAVIGIFVGAFYSKSKKDNMTYIISNLKSSNKYEVLYSITLNKDKTAKMRMPAKSNFFSGDLKYTDENGKIIIYDKDEREIAIFNKLDNLTLEFESSEFDIGVEKKTIYKMKK